MHKLTKYEQEGKGPVLRFPYALYGMFGSERLREENRRLRNKLFFFSAF